MQMDLSPVLAGAAVLILGAGFLTSVVRELHAARLDPLVALPHD